MSMAAGSGLERLFGSESLSRSRTFAHTGHVISAETDVTARIWSEFHEFTIRFTCLAGAVQMGMMCAEGIYAARSAEPLAFTLFKIVLIHKINTRNLATLSS